MRPRAGALILLALVALTLLRLWWCGRFELSPDEAYYWLWSRSLDWAYYSKGPGIALVIRAATELAGDTERGVRWPAPLLMLATTGLLWLLVRETLSRAAATCSAIALQCVPLACAGSLLMTIDPLSIFFWVLALLCGWRAVTGASPAVATVWWAACGIACGAGFLCKYTNALVLGGIVLAALSRADWRAALKGRPALALGLGFAPFLVPPIAWNAARGWPTLRHLIERGGIGREGAWLQPRETLEFLVVHFGTWSPLLFGMILAAIPAIASRAQRDAGTRFLLLTSLPILGMYSMLALHEAGEANWTGPGILGLLPLAADHWMRRARESIAARRLGIAALGVGALLSLVASNTNLVRALGISLPAKQDPATRVRGWKDTARAVHELHPGGPLLAHHYGLASELAFYGHFDERPGVIRHARPRNQFWFWQDHAAPPLASFTFVTERASLPEDPGMTCELTGERVISGPGGTLRTIRVFACHRVALQEP